MSHPENRNHRFLIGKKLGEKRAQGYWSKCIIFQNDSGFMERAAYLRRNTTKLCSCSLCGNPRRVAWKKKEQLTVQEKKLGVYRGRLQNGTNVIG